MNRHLHEVLGWPGPMTFRQQQGWWAWYESQDEHSDPYYCKVGDGPDDHVPTETYERWKLQVAQAGHKLMTKDKILMKFAKQGDQEAINRLKAMGVDVQ